MVSFYQPVASEKHHCSNLPRPPSACCKECNMRCFQWQGHTHVLLKVMATEKVQDLQGRNVGPSAESPVLVGSDLISVQAPRESQNPDPHRFLAFTSQHQGIRPRHLGQKRGVFVQKLGARAWHQHSSQSSSLPRWLREVFPPKLRHLQRIGLTW